VGYTGAATFNGVPGIPGKPSNRKIEAKVEREAIKILSAPVYEGFGPTLAAEYLA
jgi:hypothetical protein